MSEEYKQKAKVRFDNNEILINDIKNFKFFSAKFDDPLPNFLTIDEESKIQYIDINLTKLDIPFPENILEILKRIEENKYFKSFEEINKFYDEEVSDFFGFKYYLTKINNNISDNHKNIMYSFDYRNTSEFSDSEKNLIYKIVCDKNTSEYIEKYNSLEELDCSYSSCCGIADGLNKLSLKILSFSGNKNAPKYIEGYDNLEELDCSGNSSCCGIADGSNKLSLKILSFSENKNAPKFIKGYENLEKLDCSRSSCCGIADGSNKSSLKI